MKNNVQNVSGVNVDKIKALANEQGLTMKFLCACLGKGHNFLANVRNKKDNIDQNELSFIADRLNTTIEYLTNQTEHKEKPIIMDDEREALIRELNALMNQMSLPNLARFREVVRFATLSDSDFEKLMQLAQIALPESSQQQ